MALYNRLEMGIFQYQQVRLRLWNRYNADHDKRTFNTSRCD